MITTMLLAAALAAQEKPLPSGPALAAVVEQAFPAHDTNGDGKLSRAEFTAWMVALKARSDPTATPASRKTRAWVASAFALADKDRSAGVTKAELTGLLERANS